jgi:hypothetical protein
VVLGKKKKMDQTAKTNEFVERYLGKIPGWPKPEEKLVVLKTKYCQRLACLVIKNDILIRLSERDVYQYFIRYAATLGLEDFILGPPLAKQIAEHWMAKAEPVDYEAVPIFRFKGDPGYCWGRCAFDPKPGIFPTWERLCQQITNVEAFKKYTGSIFFDDSYLQQYLVLYGDANAGKGAYLRALINAFGEAGSVSKHIPPHKGDKHYFEDCVSKRFVYFDDFDDVNTFSSGAMKRWTGGCPQTIDPKGQKPFQATLNNKLVFTMNAAPEIKDSKSDLRRAILCRISKGEHVDNFEEKLAAEMPHFVYQCMAEIAHAKYKMIPVDEESFCESVGHDHAKHSYFWQKYFQIKLDNKVTSNQVQDAFLVEDILSASLQGQYYRYLEEHTKGRRNRTGRERFVENLIKRPVPEVDPLKAEKSFLFSSDESQKVVAIRVSKPSF